MLPECLHFDREFTFKIDILEKNVEHIKILGCHRLMSFFQKPDF